MDTASCFFLLTVLQYNYWKCKFKQIKINTDLLHLCLPWAPSSLHGQYLPWGPSLLGLLGEREKKKTLPRRGKKNIAVCKICVELDRFDKDISYQYEFEH